MKSLKLILAAYILLPVSTVFAQEKTWIIDANAGYNHQSFTPNGVGPSPLSLSGGSINLAVGRQLTNHWTIGILGGAGSQQSLQQYSMANGSIENAKSNLHLWHVGVYGRYNYYINKHIFLYSQLSAARYGYSLDQTTTSGNYYPVTFYDNNSTPVPEGFAASLVPAVGVNLFKGYGIHMDLGGVNYAYSNQGSYHYNNFNVNFGQQFHFGLHKIIGWKKMNNTPADPLK